MARDQRVVAEVHIGTNPQLSPISIGLEGLAAQIHCGHSTLQPLSPSIVYGFYM